MEKLVTFFRAAEIERNFAQKRLFPQSNNSQGCQIFLGTTYQNVKTNIPNNHKIDQIVTK
jgi:hypothetical protein